MRKSLKTVMTAVMALALAVTAVPAGIASATESSEDAIAAGKAAFDASGNTEYHAYLMFQVDQTWVYRNSYSEPETGRGYADFNHVLTSLDVDTPKVVDGEITDAVIKGNGTYTVKVEGMNGACLAGNPANTPMLKYVGVSTDIPTSSNITISEVKTKIDGMTKLEQATALFDDEETARSKTMTVLCNNLYRNTEELKTEIQVPNDSIEITFKVSGFDVDNPDAVEATKAPATDAAKADSSSKKDSSISTPVVVGIVVVAVVVIAGVVIVVSKKKKK
ncbi:MAG: hypothetical protein SO170_07935 [Butyribacter sp.]|nr:hypothetical protein [bacterium]MDY3854866.1 hypothetical protein [Butyribacter sp.]